MTTPDDVLRELVTRGGTLSVDGDALRVRAPAGVVTPELRTALATHKSSLLVRLRAERAAGTAPSFAQESLWFLHELEPASLPAYNTLRALRLRGPIRTDWLEQSIQYSVNRHDALRSFFPVVAGRPLLRVAAALRARLAAVDLSAFADRETALTAWLAGEAARSFALDLAPLHRATLVRLAADEHVLVLNAHHLTADAWSARVLLREIAASYAAFASGGVPGLPAPRRQFSEFAAQQRTAAASGVFDEPLAYWKKHLANLPNLQLCTDHRRPEERSFRGAGLTVKVDETVTAALRELAHREGVTRFAVVLASYALLLHRFSGQEKFGIGTSLAHRDAAEWEDSIGFFADLLVYRADFAEPGISFRELVRCTHRARISDLGHATVPHDLVVREVQPERSLATNPLFQAMLLYLPTMRTKFGLPGVVFAPEPVPKVTAQYDLALLVEDNGRTLDATFQYSTDLFSSATIERFAAAWIQLLGAAAAAPDTAIDRLPIITPVERDELTRHRFAPVTVEPPHAHLHAWFSAQAARTPTSVALSYESVRLSYDELETRSNTIAHQLVAAGCAPGDFVGLCFDRSPELVIGLLAILKAGAAYVPIDPAYPQERVEFLATDAGLRLILTTAVHAPRFASCVAANCIVPSDTGDSIVASLEISLAADSPAYVIYTSGSTGKPKGCVVTHRNVTRLMAATNDWFGFNTSDVWTLFHSISFDFSVWEIWGALLYGGRLVVVPHLVSRSPDSFYELLAVERVTVLNQTPSAFRQLIQWEEALPAPRSLALRTVIFGGEALDLTLLKPWFARHGDDRPLLVNMYGITETTVHVTYRPIRQADVVAGSGSVIGRPIPDLSVHVLDAHLEPVPTGVMGELFVGGAGLAVGYLNRPELTAQRFIANPFGPGRLYRSGDTARWLPNGDLEYLGRADDQVKIRGFRVEPGEIATVLERQKNIREAQVLVRERGAGDKRLVAYVIPRTPPLDVIRLRDACAAALPGHMVPAAFVAVAAWPLTPHGKLDRGALPPPDFEAVAATRREFAAPVPGLETVLAAAWAAALKVERVGAEDNFFELGGDSMLSVQAVAEAQQRGVPCSLAQLYRHQTVRALANALAADGVEIADAPLASFALVAADDRVRLPVDAVDAWPLPRLAQGMLFHSELNPNAPVFHDVFSFHLEAQVAEPAWRRAVAVLVAAEPALRSSLHLAGFSQPLQIVHERIEVATEYADLSTLTAEVQEQTIAAVIAAEKNHRFDYELPGLVRFYLHRRSSTDIQLTLGFHHAILDGWSVATLLTRLLQLSEDGAVEDSGSQLKLAARGNYANFVAAELAALRNEPTRTFWRNQLKGIEATHLAKMSLTATGELVRVSRSLTPGLVSGIRTLATRLGLPLKAVFFAAHVRAVAEETGTSDVISGLTAHGRDETSGAAQTLGLYLNTLPLRVRAAAPDAATLIRRVAMAEREVLPHRRMPLAEIVALHGGRPLFEASFNFTQFHVYGELLRGGKVKLRELAVFEATDLPLLTQVTVFPESERIDVDIVAQAGAFPRELVERFAVRQRELLEAWATQPAAALAEISIPTGLEVRRPADVKAAIAIDVRAPESATERELAALWSELLGIRIVDATASFFELGGNSLLAVQLVAHVRQRYRVELPLRTLFDEPTLSRLATAVDVAQSAMAPVDESSLRRTTRARVMVSVGPDGELEKE